MLKPKQAREEKIDEVQAAAEDLATERGSRKRECAVITLAAVRDERYDAFLESESDEGGDVPGGQRAGAGGDDHTSSSSSEAEMGSAARANRSLVREVGLSEGEAVEPPRAGGG